MRPRMQTGHDRDIRLFPDLRACARHAAWVGALVALPWLAGDFLTGQATLVVIWAIAGMGLMLLTGHAGQVSLGHAAFLAVGCYAHAILMSRFGLPFALSLPLAGLLAGAAGLLVAIPAARLHGIYLAILTLALSMLAEDVIVLAAPWTGGVGGLQAPEISILGIAFDRFGSPDRFYWLCLAVAVATTFVYGNVLRTALGRSLEALRDSERAAQAMGVDPVRARMTAFGLSCAATGMAGALLGHYLYIFNHEAFTIVLSIQLLLMIVIGGLRSIQGAWYGAIVLGLLPQAISFARDGLSAALGAAPLTIPGLETAVFALLLVLFLVYEPAGIHGWARKWKLWFELFPLAPRSLFRSQRSYLKTERLQ